MRPLSDTELDRFLSEDHTVGRGRAAESAAATWLAARGYQILATNYATPAGEIDVIARDRDTLCFLEVKARLDNRCGPAIAAVTRRKQLRLARAAVLYLAKTDWPGPCRFDVLGMEPAQTGWAFTLIRDAFQAP